MKALIISEHFLIREMLKILLKETVVDISVKTVNPSEYIDNDELREYDLIIFELGTHMEKIKATLEYIKSNNISAKIIIGTDNEQISEVLDYKANAYIRSIRSRNEFNFIIDSVLNNYKYYDSKLMDTVIKKEESQEIEGLTKRESEILQHLGKGLTNKAIAKELFVTEYTVKKHITSIFNKLSLKNRSEAIVYLQQMN